MKITTQDLISMIGGYSVHLMGNGKVKIIGQMDNTMDHTFESANRVYDTSGVSPTINCCGDGGLQPKVIEEDIVIGGMQEHQAIKKDGICTTLTSSMGTGGGYVPMVLSDKSIVSMRGRNPDNPSDRTAGAPTEQRLEPNSQGICNTLTSVQKDNLVMERNVVGSLYYGASEQFGCGYMDNCYKTVKAEKDDLGVLESVFAIDEQNMNIREETFGTLTTDGSSPKHNNRVMEIKKVGQISSDGSQYGTVISDSGLCSTLSAGTHGYANNCIHTQCRIRKLTPMECWRLMDFTDEDFRKAESVNSNTQLYKQAGNSIVKNVLIAIFGQMLPGKENVYKEVNKC